MSELVRKAEQILSEGRDGDNSFSQKERNAARGKALAYLKVLHQEEYKELYTHFLNNPSK